MTLDDKLTLALAAWGAVTGTIGTVTGAMAIYLQFFRKRDHLFLSITWPQHRNGPGDLLIVLTNGGDLSCVVCWFGFSYTISEASGGRRFWNPTAQIETEHSSIQLKPGDHISMVVRLPKQIPEARVREAQLSDADLSGRRVFPVVLNLEYVDSRGKKHLREVKAGDHYFDAAGKSVEMSIPSKTIDLARK